MPLLKQHNRFNTTIILLIAVVGYSIVFLHTNVSIMSMAAIFWTYSASPDLDIKGTGFWWLYNKIVKHRSILSHCHVLGTVIKTSYWLAGLILIAFLINTYVLTYSPIHRFLVYELNFDQYSVERGITLSMFKFNPRIYWDVFLGFNVSDSLHIILDNMDSKRKKAIQAKIRKSIGLSIFKK